MNREVVASLLEETARALREDATIPVPEVRMHFIASARNPVPRHDAVMASMATFPCGYAYSVDGGGFLHCTGYLADNFRVTISAKASALPAFAGAVLRGEEGAAAA